MKRKNIAVIIFLGSMCFFWLRYFFVRSQCADFETIRIGFLGDVMLGRMVNASLHAHSDFDAPWGDMKPLLHATDCNIANMEFALTTSDQIVPKVFHFKSLPEHVGVLQAGNIGVVNLANNHVLDYGIPGLLETIKTLDAAGISHVGAGVQKTAAQAPVILDIKGLKIGVIGCTDNEPDWIATDQKPGIHYIKVGDIDIIAPLIQSIRLHVDLLILTMHWGPNMRSIPTKNFIQFARDLVDAGVDIIHGHSAHLFQAVECYKKGLIMYDTGDALDDYATDDQLRNDRSFFFEVVVSKKGIQKVHLTPFIIVNMHMQKAPDKDIVEMIKQMQKLSAQQGTIISQEGDIVFK